MPRDDWFVLMGMGCLFILLGVGAIMRGRSEEKSYYNSLVTRPDSREFLEHQPEWPQFAALKIGGRIAFAVGLLMLIMGGIFRLAN